MRSLHRLRILDLRLIPVPAPPSWDGDAGLPVQRERLDGRACVVVYTVRGSAVCIISACKANRKEVADYEQNAHQY